MQSFYVMASMNVGSAKTSLLMPFTNLQLPILTRGYYSPVGL